MKSFVNDLYEYDYTGEQTKNNEEESSDDEEIDIQITVVWLIVCVYFYFK